MKLLIGKKLNMSQMFAEDGTVIPVTRVSVQTARVTQVKTEERDGYSAVQLGFNEGSKHVSKPIAGHVSGTVERPLMREIRLSDTAQFKVGQSYDLSSFSVGEKVSVSGFSKGRGFTGVIKRHHFHGADASHGTKHHERSPGSIGATDAARVFPGMKMAGRTGNARATIKNLTIAEIDEKSGVISIRGAIPGSRNGLVEIVAEGDMKLVEAEKK